MGRGAVLDSTAILAVLFNEPGSEAVVPLLDGALVSAVNLAEVIDASILLRGGTGVHEVGNRDGGQQTNDGDDNHDFNQCETPFAGSVHFHNFDYCCNFLDLQPELSERRV